MIEQKQIDLNMWNMWNSRFRMTNVLCSDGKYRTFTQTAEPDTFFTTPGRVKVKGKTVTGHLYYDSSYNDYEGIWKFSAYSYRKNHDLLPEWS